MAKKLFIDGQYGNISIAKDTTTATHRLAPNTFPSEFNFHSDLPYVREVATISTVVNFAGVTHETIEWDDSSKGCGKVICTAMNNDYGFGSYRNAIWLKFAELNFADKPEMEVGYHALVIPMLKIRKKAEDDSGSSGLIAGFRITEGDDFYQSYFDPTDKHICIVKDNKVNKSILGDLSNMNPKNPTFRKTQKTGLCDILSEEISILLVDIMIDKGKISIDYDGHQEYIQHIKEKKNEIFDLMFSIIDNN